MKLLCGRIVEVVIDKLFDMPHHFERLTLKGISLSKKKKTDIELTNGKVGKGVSDSLIFDEMLLLGLLISCHFSDSKT